MKIADLLNPQTSFEVAGYPSPKLTPKLVGEGEPQKWESSVSSKEVLGSEKQESWENLPMLPESILPYFMSIESPSSSSSIAAASSTSKRFQCSKCSSTFSRTQELQRHMRSLHPGPNAPRFSCPNCSKVFPRPDALKRHLESKKAKLALCKPLSSLKKRSK